MKTDEKLEALAAYHENMARSIRVTIEAMSGEDIKRAQATFTDKIKGALTASGARIGRPPKAENGNGHVVTKAATKAHSKASKGGTVHLAGVLKEAGVRLNREELRAKLREIGQEGAMSAVGAAIRYGYIKGRGNGKNRQFEFKTMPEVAPA